MTESASASRLTRNCDDWISGFLAFTEGISSPRIFRKWAAITTIGACLERRVWVATAKGFTFPNIFVILLGRPGIGKTEAINSVRSLVRATKLDGVFEQACHLAPVDVTKGALYDYLQGDSVKRRGPDPLLRANEQKEDRPYHSAFLAVSELGDMVREYDTQLLSALHSLYDCLPVIEEERRYRADKPIKIPNAQISLLAGTTPSHLSRAFPPGAWDEGFMARTILIYSTEQIIPDLFSDETLDMALAQDLVKDLRQIGRMSGKMEFTDAAKESIVAWQKSGEEPKPKHIRLEHYNTRRMRHALKLSMIAAANRGNVSVVDVEDFQQALAWMLEAEEAMPQIFMEMMGRSDGQVMNELYEFVRGLWELPLHGKKPIRKGMLVNFLRNKVPAWQIEKIIETAVEAELLILSIVHNEQTGQQETRYKPNPNPSLFNPKRGKG